MGKTKDERIPGKLPIWRKKEKPPTRIIVIIKNPGRHPLKRF